VPALTAALNERNDDRERVRAVMDALVAAGVDVGDTQSPNYCSRQGELTQTSNM